MDSTQMKKSEREREGESMIWKSFCTPKTKMTIQKKNPSKKEDVYAINNGDFPASHVRFGGAYIKGTQKKRVQAKFAEGWWKQRRPYLKGLNEMSFHEKPLNKNPWLILDILDILNLMISHFRCV